MTRRMRLISLVLVAAFAAPVLARAAEPPKVSAVISVKVTGDRQAYYGKLKNFQAITKRLGLPQARIWRETVGGEGADTIHIVTEYPSLAAWAESQNKLNADPEAAKFLRDLDTSGIRTLLGRSLMVDETP